MKKAGYSMLVRLLGIILAIGFVLTGCGDRADIADSAPSSETSGSGSETTVPSDLEDPAPNENQAENDNAILTDEYLISLVYGLECALRNDNQFTFDHPEELSESQLYILFLLLTEYAVLEDQWDSDEGAFCFTSDVICSQLQKYFKSFVFDITEHEKYDEAKNAIITPTASGFGGDRNMKLVSKEIDGNTASFAIDFFEDYEMQTTAYQRKTYMIEFYEGGYYYLSAEVDDADSSMSGTEAEFITAEFGAPAEGNGTFPLDLEAASKLKDLLSTDRNTLSQYEIVAAPDFLPLIVLGTADGGSISLGKNRDQLLLCVGEVCYDCTGKVDFDALCLMLEEAQRQLVLTSIPTIIEIAMIDPEDDTRNRQIELNQEQQAEIAELLQTNQWEIADMYTAQDLSRGWPEFIDLYCDNGLTARISYGNIQGSLRTVIFYYIESSENQRANILAPGELYGALRTFVDAG